MNMQYRIFHFVKFQIDHWFSCHLWYWYLCRTRITAST